ncbi:hypothetical protein ABZ635_23305 [Nocardiopsis sp. NPDC007018]|uniref:hypothetical protein n=1 Tax=Nocardiopsis sp. NPDC007018 TaxID=3155721 RepID=UPI0033EDD781
MPVLDRAALRRWALLPPACLLVSACAPDGGAVGAVATGHFSARHQFPVVQVAWCGDSPPARIDLTSEEHGWRLTANRAFEGDRLEVDLSAPGEDWTITDTGGEPAYRVVPDSPETAYTLEVTSAAGAEDGADGDIAALEFHTESLASDDGLILGTHQGGEGTLVGAQEFPPEC